MKYFQNSLCVETLEANPRAFLLLPTNYHKKEFPQLWSVLTQAAQTQFHKVYWKDSIHIINEKMLHVLRPSVNWLNESMSKSDYNHAVAVQLRECVKVRGLSLPLLYTLGYVDTCSSSYSPSPDRKNRIKTGLIGKVADFPIKRGRA